MSTWQPTAALHNLKARAQLLKQLRSFFEYRDVLEVNTPVLASAGVTDPFIDNFTSTFAFDRSGQPQTLYLQTSPEYAMKRLLAAGCEHIYQIAPAFRHEDYGRFHNPEFTMLEWYRTGFSMQDLIDEVAELLIHVLGVPEVKQLSYEQAFIDYLAINPFTADITELSTKAYEVGIALHSSDNVDTDDLLQLLFATAIEPVFAQDFPVVVSHFPVSQAALATVNKTDSRTANRFEAYYRGIELANGFHELTDPVEQRKRFENDNAKRRTLGLPAMPLDEHFLAALASGMPSCAGVAMGVDRLLMLVLQAENIGDVMAFGFPNH